MLAAFLGPQGLQHPNRLVSGRASYLFMRLVKNLRGQMGGYMETVMNHLVAGASSPTSSFLCYKRRTGWIETNPSPFIKRVGPLGTRRLRQPRFFFFTANVTWDP